MVVFINISKIYIDKIDNEDNMDRMVKVQLKESIVNKLIQKKKIGDTYSDVVERLLK